MSDYQILKKDSDPLSQYGSVNCEKETHTRAAYLNEMSIEATNLYAQCTTCRPTPVYTRPTGTRNSSCDGQRKRNAQKKCVSPLTELNRREEDLFSRVEFLSAKETLNCVWGEIKFWNLGGKQFGWRTF